MASIVEQIVRIVTDGEETRAEVVGELVRCKDCKYFEHDSVEKINGIPLIVAHEICRRSTGLVYATSNDYCSRGERKETEDERVY